MNNNTDEIDMEELKKQFFIDGKEFTISKIKNYVEDIKKYAQPDNEGNIYINNEKNISSKDKILIYAISRFLANKIDDNVNSEFTADEIYSNIGCPKNQVIARINELVKEKYVNRVNKGKYKFIDFKIENALKLINNKYGD